MLVLKKYFCIAKGSVPVSVAPVTSPRFTTTLPMTINAWSPAIVSRVESCRSKLSTSPPQPRGKNGRSGVECLRKVRVRTKPSRMGLRRIAYLQQPAKRLWRKQAGVRRREVRVVMRGAQADPEDKPFRARAGLTGDAVSAKRKAKIDIYNHACGECRAISEATPRSSPQMASCPFLAAVGMELPMKAKTRVRNITSHGEGPRAGGPV